MAVSNGSGKFALGLLLGAAFGAALAYFSDRSKRERFSDDFSNAVDRTRDGVIEGYYTVRDKYQQYRDNLQDATAEILDDVREEIAD
ncbi:MAG: YtxH domain-containing protein [Porphyromonadaceae bacterium]|nr:YtxH domain-containing protein [Porphyromonadaceae bacterium]